MVTLHNRQNESEGLPFKKKPPMSHDIDGKNLKLIYTNSMKKKKTVIALPFTKIVNTE